MPGRLRGTAHGCGRAASFNPQPKAQAFLAAADGAFLQKNACAFGYGLNEGTFGATRIIGQLIGYSAKRSSRNSKCSSSESTSIMVKMSGLEMSKLESSGRLAE